MQVVVCAATRITYKLPITYCRILTSKESRLSKIQRQKHRKTKRQKNQKRKKERQRGGRHGGQGGGVGHHNFWSFVLDDYDLKRSVDLRCLFDHLYYIHLR